MKNLTGKKTLIGMDLTECENFVEKIGSKRYRGRQIYKWMYSKKAFSFEEMTDIPIELRNELKKHAQLTQLTIEEIKKSTTTGTSKYLFKLADGHFIESVYIPEGDRHTVCLSSQVGCSLNCQFCATARLGFKRNLTAGEIIEQILQIEKNIKSRITNVVFMGMGEPFLNYENVIKAVTVISEDNGMAIGARRIVISTAGIVDKIKKYTDEKHKARLAISLNTAFAEQRKLLMPITKKWELDQLLSAVLYYAKSSRKTPTLEYVLLANINDSKAHANALKAIVKKIPCKVNLIPYNPTNSPFKRPSEASVERFAQWLLPLKAGLSVRWSKGDDMNAACGQLAGDKK